MTIPTLRLSPVLLLAAVLCTAAAGRAPAQPAVDVSITVRAEEGGAPIAGAQVEVLGSRRYATAGADGVARLRVRPGPALFAVRKLGYGTEQFSLNLPQTDSVGIEVDLAVAPVQLDPLHATASATETALRDAGFYNRQKTGIGVFLTGRDIARHNAARLVDTFRRVPGVRVMRYLPAMGRRLGGSRSAMDVDEQYRIASPRGSTTINGSPNCWLDVYMDDMPVGAEVLTQLPVGEVIAIEVYRGPAETPGQYRRTANGCGAVVIWTRRGRAS